MAAHYKENKMDAKGFVALLCVVGAVIGITYFACQEKTTSAKDPVSSSEVIDLKKEIEIIKEDLGYSSRSKIQELEEKNNEQEKKLFELKQENQSLKKELETQSESLKEAKRKQREVVVASPPPKPIEQEPEPQTVEQAVTKWAEENNCQGYKIVRNDSGKGIYSVIKNAINYGTFTSFNFREGKRLYFIRIWADPRSRLLIYSSG